MHKLFLGAPRCVTYVINESKVRLSSGSNTELTNILVVRGLPPAGKVVKCYSVLQDFGAPAIPGGSSALKVS